MEQPRPKATETAAAPPSDAGGGALLPARLLIPWAVLVAGAVVLGAGLGVQGASYPTPVALPHAYRLLVGAELLGLVVLGPLARRPGGSGGAHLLRLALLVGMGAPAVVAASWVADAAAASVALSQSYLLAAACAVAGWMRLDAARRLDGWYWLVMGGLGGAAPVMAFVAGDVFRADLVWLYALSPFWVADRLCYGGQFAWEWMVPFAAVVLAAAALHLWPQKPRHDAGPSPLRR